MPPVQAISFLRGDRLARYPRIASRFDWLSAPSLLAGSDNCRDLLCGGEESQGTSRLLLIQVTEETSRVVQIGVAAPLS